MRVLETQPGLSRMVVEAVQALSKLDAERLEELACACRALNSEQGRAGRPAVTQDAHISAEDMAALARVLEVTRANLEVMNRLREFHARRIEYSAVQGAALHGTEVSHGVR